LTSLWVCVNRVRARFGSRQSSLDPRREHPGDGTIAVGEFVREDQWEVLAEVERYWRPRRDRPDELLAVVQSKLPHPTPSALRASVR
jgi:hypothetical protein